MFEVDAETANPPALEGPELHHAYLGLCGTSHRANIERYLESRGLRCYISTPECENIEIGITRSRYAVLFLTRDRQTMDLAEVEMRVAREKVDLRGERSVILIQVEDEIVPSTLNKLPSYSTHDECYMESLRLALTGG